MHMEQLKYNMHLDHDLVAFTCYITIISENRQLFVNDSSSDSLFLSEGGRSKETECRL